MKLPPKDDPHGDREGALPRAQVLDTLYRNEVSVTHDPDGDVILQRGHRTEVQSLPDPVGGLLVRYLADRFGVLLEDFYFGNRH